MKKQQKAKPKNIAPCLNCKKHVVIEKQHEALTVDDLPVYIGLVPGHYCYDDKQKIHSWLPFESETGDIITCNAYEPKNQN